MNIKDIQQEIKRIAKIEDPEKCQKEVRELADLIGRKGWNYTISGDWVYFYRVSYRKYKGKTHMDTEESLGRMEKSEFQQRKKALKRMEIEELKGELSGLANHDTRSRRTRSRREKK